MDFVQCSVCTGSDVVPIHIRTNDLAYMFTYTRSSASELLDMRFKMSSLEQAYEAVTKKKEVLVEETENQRKMVCDGYGYTYSTIGSP